MASFSTKHERDSVTITTQELALAFSREDGGLRELRRAGGTNTIGFGTPMPTVDVELHDRGWLANQSFVRYLRHTVEQSDGTELTITIGIGPLIVRDSYRITGTLLARRVTLCNAGEDALHLRGVRLLLPWACVGTLDSCRFDAPGNRARPHAPLAVVAQRGPSAPTAPQFERAPTEGPGVLMLHDPASEETLACWYFSAVGTAMPQVQGNGRALTLSHEVELDEVLQADDCTVAGTQWLLLLREPWHAALGAIRRTWALCGLQPLERPAAWLRDAAIYETHPALWGGFSGLLAQLPRLCALGLNTICLLPVWDFANLSGRLWDGNWQSSGDLYALRDLEHLDPTLGSPGDLRTLADAAHDLGMRVLLDLPLEGCAADAPLVEQHAEWFCYDSVGQIAQLDQHPGIAPFDWEQAGLRSYMLEWALAQLQLYALDGFRILMPRVVTPPHPGTQPALPNLRMGALDLIEQLRNGMLTLRSDAVLVGALAGPLYESLHDGAMHEVAHHMFMQLGLGQITPVEIGAWLEDAALALPRSATPICFTEYYRTRSISPLADGLRGSRLSRMLMAGMVLCGFAPLIGHDQDGVDGVFIGNLLRARADFAALRQARAIYNALPCSSPQVFAVWRSAEHEHLIGVLNVGPHKHTVVLSLPVDRLALPEGEYELYELFSRRAWAEAGQQVWARDELLALQITLEPFTAYCLAVRAVPTATSANEPIDALSLAAYSSRAAAVAGK